MPPTTPVTIPVLKPTEATPVLLLLHVPPDTVSVKVEGVVTPEQSTSEPPMTDGVRFTFITVEVLQSPPSV